MITGAVMMLGAVISASSIDPYILNAAQRHNVEPAIIHAIIKVESNWDTTASRYESHLNDSSLGLMQVLLKTAREQLKNPGLTTTQLFDPQTNIEAGTRYIAYQLRRYNGNIKDAFAAYNAGSKRLTSSGAYINQSYVDKAYNAYQMYKSQSTISTAQISKTTSLVSTKYAVPAILSVVLLVIVSYRYFHRSK